ncbi:ABC-three component system middle component 1 [Chishuiella sp.]|uniref:ABC-three component system middle component 1 n=1 Tax=Chishuiella sp. TaxID=1969467 RepID=UPI0028A85D1D|nr:ABC-three component system middle component 1 [Chishuiella sp.]
MIQTIINKIFEESNFEEKEGYYSKDNNQFYLTLKLKETEFQTIENKNSIEVIPSYKELLDFFNELVQSGTSTSIEKNTSLLIFVECENIKALEVYKQQILVLEEDQYFFKKYVILYTENGISGINTDTILSDLKAKLSNKDNFDNYYTNGFSTELEGYLFILQLYIKIPFITLPSFDNQFKTLETKITEDLGDNYIIKETVIEKFDEIMAIDFFVPGENVDQNIETILNSLSND